MLTPLVNHVLEDISIQEHLQHALNAQSTRDLKLMHAPPLTKSPTVQVLLMTTEHAQLVLPDSSQYGQELNAFNQQ